MESTASKLKTKRESLDISLEQVSEYTRISIHHLKSLESGRYADLPGGMYNRAILRAYCDEIGLDKDELLKCYDDEITPRHEKPATGSQSQPVSKIEIKAHTVLVCIMIFIFGIGLFLSREWFVTALSPYLSSDYGNPPEQSLVVSRSNGNEANEVEVNEELSEPTVQATFNTDAVDLQPLRIEIVGKEECWLLIDRDESGAVEKILSPGDVEFFTATRMIYLHVGNAGGISMRINDRAAKTLGRSGQVVRLTINEDTLPNLIDPSAS